MAAWTWRDAAINDYEVVAARQEGTTVRNAFWLGFQGVEARVGVFGVSLQRAFTTPFGRWVHIAGTYDGTTLRLYIDGALVGSLALSGL